VDHDKGIDITIAIIAVRSEINMTRNGKLERRHQESED
jgi:hypothetical protein